ncbi:nicotinate-nucleotide adenylyltransferase [Rhodothalassium salexigens DSM 2132]|uniref:Probable nicotinate-nucleotide adenylyltransferase n=1 Tax=Rhodothalassium salexigens DSM 2132 TaxID=1188247 RepID=A0A4V2SPT7_RHOSA|nr:nicotinate-nucleotide adenylyltransferase [Rhodothalassium salexigens]MBB4210866.1 nicotinate-nucleotide adenylyltransferase [Rhodothalassium salexigens DSM 2132]TCP36476.1 nicotinate-nucleotide adenylyltransferase [Rhodothalassium salexigens DSM 2132]
MTLASVHAAAPAQVRALTTPPVPPAGADLWAGQRVGLLGGSFNPAHDGHHHISKVALRRLGLDWVWWLVSPQNPLKPKDDMAPFAARFASAEAAARHPRVLVSDLETHIATRFTADTIAELSGHFPRTRFVWLMGADNLVQFTRWQHWDRIAHTVPIAVIDRPGYSHAALTAKMARIFAHRRCPERQWQTLATRSLPAWAFITCPRHPASATRIRETMSDQGMGPDGPYSVA